MIDLTTIKHVADIPRAGAKAYGDALAFWYQGRETTYNDMDERSSRIANGLLDLGVKPGDRVCFLGKNTEQFYEVLFGVVKARGAMTGVNNSLAPPEIAYVLNDSQAPVLFVTADFFDAIDEIKADCPNLKHIIALEGEHEGWPVYETWRDGQSDTDPMLTADPDDDVVQLYTSGTTGFPKGVQLSDHNYVCFFDQTNDLEWALYTPGEVIMNAMPLFHVAGVNMGILAMAQGAETVVVREIDPQVILKLVEDRKIAHAFWVPAVILMLTQQPNIHEIDFSALKHVSYGASPIAEDLLKNAISIMKCRFTQLYGLTETIGSATFLPHEAHAAEMGKLRSCGKPWPRAEIRTVDENGNSVPTGEVGEIVIKSDVVMKGYWNKPEATADAIRNGWFYSGDAGYFDEDGFLYIHDRVKDMIVSGGENIYPAEVENAIFGHEGVADVAVIGIPSEKWGEEVKAIVVKAPGADPTPDNIIAYARTRIAGYKAPKSVDFIAELPRNPSGKILRKDLREPYWKGVERRVG